MIDTSKYYKLPVYEKIIAVCQGNVDAQQKLFAFVEQGYNTNSIIAVTESLKKADITGDKISVFVGACCKDSYVRLINTLPIIENNSIEPLEVQANLAAKNPVDFLDDKVVSKFTSDVDDISDEVYSNPNFKLHTAKSFQSRFEQANGISLEEVVLKLIPSNE